eukprot:1778413-Rhodomonas_salina.1
MSTHSYLDGRLAWLLLRLRLGRGGRSSGSSIDEGLTLGACDPHAWYIAVDFKDHQVLADWARDLHLHRLGHPSRTRIPVATGPTPPSATTWQRHRVRGVALVSLAINPQVDGRSCAFRSC